MQTTYRLYDARGRPVYEDFRGDAGGTGIVRHYEYSPFRGVLEEVWQTVAGAPRRTTFTYDNLRRKVSETRSYDPQANGGEPSPSVHDKNQRVVFVYGAPNASRALDRDPYRVLERWAYDTPGEGEAQELKLQKTRWVYGPPAGAGTGESEISSGALLWKIAYPDPETGEAHFDPENPDRAEDAPYQVTLAYDREGQVRWKRTQAYKPAEGPPDPEDASVFEYEYDQYSGRLLAERVTHFRTGVDEALDAVSWTYDRLGRLASVVTKSGEAVLSEVAYEYGGFGEVLRSYEEHGGAKSPSSLRVEYAYSADGIPRLEGVVYPDDVGLTPARKTVYYRYSPANPPKCELA